MGVAAKPLVEEAARVEQDTVGPVVGKRYTPLRLPCDIHTNRAVRAVLIEAAAEL